MAVVYPRCYVSIAGTTVPCISASVTKKAKRAADTFTAELSIAQTTLYGFGAAEWADWQAQDVAIVMSTMAGGGDQVSMVTGKIDMPKIKWDDMTVSLQGRDKSSSLIETRRSQKFPNQKSADIVSAIAQANGLNPRISTSSSDYAGKKYNDNDTNHLVLHRTDFEVLSDLADREGCRWYVSGSDLVFEPKDQGGSLYSAMWCPPGTVAPYGVATIWSLETGRNMTAAKPHTVNVKSHHPKDGLVTGSAQANGVGNRINIDHHHNGKTQDQVDKLAKSRAMDAIRHELNVTAKGPLDLTVDPKSMQIQLSGTTTIYDQTYDIDAAKFDISWDSGGEMELTCKSANGRTVSQGGGSDGSDSASGDSGDGT